MTQNLNFASHLLHRGILPLFRVPDRIGQNSLVDAIMSLYEYECHADVIDFGNS